MVEEHKNVYHVPNFSMTSSYATVMTY